MNILLSTWCGACTNKYCCQLSEESPDKMLLLWSIFIFLLPHHNYGIRTVIKKTTDNPTWDRLIKDIYQCKCAPFDPKANSTVIYKIHGRLGNHMMGYAMLLGLKRTFGYKAYLEPHVLATLEYYFEGTPLQLPSVDWLCEEHPSYPWETVIYGPKHLAPLSIRVGSAIEIPKNLRLLGNNLVKRLHWDLVLNPIAEELKRTFVFRKRFVDRAQEILRTVAADYKEQYNKKRVKKNKKEKKKLDVTFVGLHLRKTDSEKLMVELYNMPRLHASYYLDAIDLYRQKYRHAVFLLIGDNMEWGRLNILSRAGSAPIYPAGNGLIADMDGVGVDFATLTQCNHTILSYGTFSFWSGFLSGGQRVIPAMVLNRERKNPLDTLVLPPFAMTDHGLSYN